MSETESSYVEAMLVQARDYEAGRAARWKAKATQLETENARLREVLKPAADAMESVAKRLPAYSPPVELLLLHAWKLRATQGIEARSDETQSGSAEGESPVAESDAP